MGEHTARRLRRFGLQQQVLRQGVGDRQQDAWMGHGVILPTP
jgi:hypothetical protein